MLILRTSLLQTFVNFNNIYNMDMWLLEASERKDTFQLTSPKCSIYLRRSKLQEEGSMIDSTDDESCQEQSKQGSAIMIVALSIIW